MARTRIFGVPSSFSTIFCGFKSWVTDGWVKKKVLFLPNSKAPGTRNQLLRQKIAGRDPAKLAEPTELDVSKNMVFLIIRKQTQNRHQLNQLNGILLLNNEGLKLQHISYTLNVQQKTNSFCGIWNNCWRRNSAFSNFQGTQWASPWEWQYATASAILVYKLRSARLSIQKLQRQDIKETELETFESSIKLKEKTHPTSKEQK